MEGNTHLPCSFTTVAFTWITPVRSVPRFLQRLVATLDPQTHCAGVSQAVSEPHPFNGQLGGPEHGDRELPDPAGINLEAIWEEEWARASASPRRWAAFRPLPCRTTGFVSIVTSQLTSSAAALKEEISARLESGCGGGGDLPIGFSSWAAPAAMHSRSVAVIKNRNPCFS